MASDSLSGELSGLFWILATAVLWSFVGLLSKHCLTQGMPALEVAFFRALFGAAAFMVYLAVSGRLRIPLRDALLLSGFGAWGIGCYYACAQVTIQLCGAAMDIILQYTAPFWVAVFARVFFKERMTMLKSAAMSVAAAGAVCVCLSGGSIGGEPSWAGIVSGLVSGLCYATHYPFTRWSQGRYPSSVTFGWMLAGGAAVLLLVNMASGQLRWSLPASVWLCSASTGVLCTCLAFYCYGQALRRMSLVKAVVISEVEPVLSMLWVWMAFGESFSAVGWAGSILIILSVLMLSVRPSE